MQKQLRLNEHLLHDNHCGTYFMDVTSFNILAATNEENTIVSLTLTDEEVEETKVR